MKLTPQQQQQLDEALRQVYQSREQLPINLDAHWQADVMRSIRRLEPAGRNPLALFDAVVWKFAAAAGAFVVALSLYASVIGWNPLSDLADYFFSNPVQFAIVQSFGEVLNLWVN
ncbi:hypothetical protein U14_02761 [Candidatus Moduliflexus flocculans]|uniref:Uncharacterized protein n=1 Tax=Candidatus Moduliflexus flocculans TaxID=1499966 RepID=A0A081BMA0_9BACT|nr:hypothetical protein U14_02761 [Candidatus Moduliflexus flocculans]